MSIKHGLITVVLILVVVWAVSESPFAGFFGLAS
jgi:hypothetical protein